MRLLHVSDWHLGRTTYNVSRAPDHDRVLAETVELASETKPHLIVHSGDVWDAFRPAYADLQRGLDALKELGAIAPTVVVLGNHDSPHLFDLLQGIVGREYRITFVARARRPSDGGVLEVPGVGDEIIRLAPLPFVHQNRMIDDIEDPTTWNTTYADRVQRIEDALGAGLREGYDPSRHTLLFAAHLHVTGASFSATSQRPLTVTDSYATRAERIPAVTYAAYGHIHRPQQIPGTRLAWYAGSPMPLDFGEEGERKVALTVEALPGRPAQVEEHELHGSRRLRRLEGTLDQLRALAPTVGEALCLVTVSTDQPIVDLSDQVVEMLPQATVLQVDERSARRELQVLRADEGGEEREPTFSELFKEYVADRGVSEGDAEEVVRLFDRSMATLANGLPTAYPEIEAMRGAEVEAGP
ncbi:MAG: exonuclease SbcCD subunit D [Candidatus Dormibacteraceae bacterium]